MKKIIFIDFDGTITKTDSCFAMVKAFAKEGWRELNRLWENKQLSTAECANMTFKLFDVSIEQIKQLMDTMEIDEYFKEFLAACEKKGYDTYILSDGYDFNIQTILQRYDIDIKYFANRLLHDCEKAEVGTITKFSIDSPYKSAVCGNCGTCKTSLIKKLKREGCEAIYIGDGYSDMCPAAIADIVFAKDVLYRYCREKGINAVYFENFKDIISSGLIY